MVAGISSSINSLLAANYSEIGQQASVQQLRAQEAAIKSQAQAAIGKAGPNATVTASYTYGQGPDGQLYVTGVTVTSQKKVEGGINPVTRDGQSPYHGAFRDAYEERQQSLKDLAKPKADLSPSEEAQIFSIDQFREETLNSTEAITRARYQAADFGTRLHEGQHFRAGAGITTPPEYTFEQGPDGVFYAVAGEVEVQGITSTDPEKVAAHAETAARAATAPGDASAQDFTVASQSQAHAGSLRGQAQRQQQVADLYQRNFNIQFEAPPVYAVAA